MILFHRFHLRRATIPCGHIFANTCYEDVSLKKKVPFARFPPHLFFAARRAIVVAQLIASSGDRKPENTGNLHRRKNNLGGELYTDVTVDGSGALSYRYERK